MSDRDKLHAAIMNLYLPEGWDYDFSQGMRLAYKVGHRDARHAAAELASAAWSARDSEVERLREALNETLGALENLWLERIGSRDWFDQQTVVQSARSLLSSQDKESA